MAESDDLRQFIRDIALRHEKIWQEQRELFQGMLVDMREQREQMSADHRAQNDALLHILDRLQNGGAQA